MLPHLFVNKAKPKRPIAAGQARQTAFKEALFVAIMEAGSFAKIEGRHFEYYMTKRRVVLGRSKRPGDVDINIRTEGFNRYISRKHLDIVLDRNSFYALCRGKNGIFIDNSFKRHDDGRVLLPSSCIIRFPSTDIRVAFTSLLEDLGPPPPMHSPALPNRVDVAGQHSSPARSPFVSPMPSPTGTISVVNSCPVSPNSDFRSRAPSYDFKAMATYASKLLSSQQQSDTEGQCDEEMAEDGDAEDRDDRGEAEEMGGVNSDGMTSDLAVVAREDGEEEGERKMDETLPQGNEGEEGGAPGNSSTDKTREGASLDEVDKLPSEKPHQKPLFSYAQLIVQALLASKERKQTLSNIYAFISEKYPFYKLEDKGWKNSIRHNLSLNQYFMKAPREREGLGFGKGGYWCMHPDYEDKLIAQAYNKRKKKGIPVFPSAGLLSSRSAPPSPTHHTFMPEINLKEIETKLPMATPPTTTHFTLPQFFPQLTGAGNSSHSLPSSPSRSRAPGGFSATPLKFFPMGVHHRSSSTDDILAAQQKVAASIAAAASHKPPMREVITLDDRDPPPPTKRVRIMEDQRSPLEGRGDMLRDSAGGGLSAAARSIQVPTITSLPSAVQFLSIPLMPTSGLPTGPPPAPPAPPTQTLLTQPLSSFLPQSFFTMAGHAHSGQPVRSDAGNGPSTSGGGANNEE